MIDHSGTGKERLADELGSAGYWPARALQALSQERYAQAVALCRERLTEDDTPMSGRLVYALALYRSGQVDAARSAFERLLAADPDHLVALHHLADLRHAEGDEMGAVVLYERILAIDPKCRALRCEWSVQPRKATRTIRLERVPEKAKAAPPPAKELPFYTETLGDLYLSQGYGRLAASVYERLGRAMDDPRLKDKISKAMQGDTGKED